MKKPYFLTFLLILFAFSSPAVYGASSKIPILMYHDISSASQSDNPWAVTQQSFYDDMLFLKQKNYTTLLPEDVIAIKNGQSELPLKPIMITFDDGYTSNYQYGLPVLDALNMNATVAVITSLMRTDQNEGSPEYLTWSQISAMSESGCFDIGSHTHNLHNISSTGDYIKGGINGIGRLASEDETAYLKRTGEDLQTSINLIKTYTKKTPCYFAYPYGNVDKWFTKNLNDNGIQMTTTVTYKIADIKKGLTQLPRLTVTPSESASFVLTKKNQKASLQAKTTTHELNINNKNISFSGFLIDDNAYVSISELQKQCSNSNSAFNVLQNSNKELSIEKHSLNSVSQQTPSTTCLKANINVNYCDRTIDLPPQLISIGSGYAVAFPIDEEYFIRLKDVNKLLLNNAMPTT